MKLVTQKIDDLVKFCQQQVAKNLEAGHLENFLVFKINNKSILGVDISINNFT